MRLRALLVLLVGSACHAPPKEANDDLDWPVHAYYRALAQREQFASSALEATDSDYARRFRAQSQEKAELREYAFHGKWSPGEPAAHGALQFDETLLARKFEATPFPEWNVEKMVTLAGAQRLTLHGLADVRWFLHADVSSLPRIDVKATADPSRFEFHRATSGEVDPAVWRTLILDAAGVPQRIE